MIKRAALPARARLLNSSRNHSTIFLLFLLLFFTLYTLGSNGHHHPCLPSSVLFTLSSPDGKLELSAGIILKATASNDR